MAETKLSLGLLAQTPHLLKGTKQFIFPIELGGAGREIREGKVFAPALWDESSPTGLG